MLARFWPTPTADLDEEQLAPRGCSVVLAAGAEALKMRVLPRKRSRGWSLNVPRSSPRNETGGGSHRPCAPASVLTAPQRQPTTGAFRRVPSAGRQVRSCGQYLAWQGPRRMRGGSVRFLLSDHGVARGVPNRPRSARSLAARHDDHGTSPSSPASCTRSITGMNCMNRAPHSSRRNRYTSPPRCSLAACTVVSTLNSTPAARSSPSPRIT